MKAIKCDICGKYFDIENKKIKVIIPDGRDIDIKLDLCKDCESYIEDFIKRGGK